MKLLTSIRGAIGRFFTNIALWLCAKFDNDFKRMLVLAIIHSKWIGGDIVKERYAKIGAMNEQMCLVKDTKALKFPTCIADKCLFGIPSLTEAKCSPDFGWRRAWRAIPCWLRYADEEAFRNDMQRLLSLCATPVVA